MPDIPSSCEVIAEKVGDPTYFVCGHAASRQWCGIGFQVTDGPMIAGQVVLEHLRIGLDVRVGPNEQ